MRASGKTARSKRSAILFIHENAYKRLTAQLSQALTQRGLPVPAEAELSKALRNYFEYTDLELAHAMHHDVPNWHLVECNDEALYSSYNELQAAPSAQAALAFVLACADDYRLYADVVSVQGSSIELWRDNQVFLSIRPIHYETAVESARARVKSAVKGIRRTGDMPRLAQRLARMPGLGMLTADKHLLEPHVGGGGVVPLIANWPGFLREMLDGLRCPAPLNVAQSIVAAMFGYPSWQVLQAKAAARAPWLPPCVVFDDVSGVTRFYQDELDSLAAFAGLCRNLSGVESLSVSVLHRLLLLAEAASPDGRILGPTLLSAEVLVEVFETPSIYMDLAAELLSTEPARMAEALTVALGAGQSRTDRLALSQKRTGHLPTLQLGDWRFTLTPHTPLGTLRVEQLDDAGRRRAAPVYAPLHKSEVYAAFQGGYDLVLDYGRELGVHLPLTFEQVTALGTFSGIRVLPETWSPLPNKGLALGYRH